MVRGLKSPFKQSVFYDYNCNMRLKLLKEIIMRLEAVGARVRSCCFDLGWFLLFIIYLFVMDYEIIKNPKLQEI